MRKLSNNQTAAVAFLFLGILALIVGSASMVKRSKYIEVEATITSIEEEYNTYEDQFYYTTFVKYQADGREYEEEIGYHEPDFAEGQTIEIRYNPDNPAQIEAASLGFLLYLLILGAILVPAGIFLLLRRKN